MYNHTGFVRPPSTLWEWAVAIGYTVAPWVLLWVVGDHAKFRQAVGAGILFALIAMTLDDIGVSLFLWWYPEQPIPLTTGNAAWNVVGAAPEGILVSEKALSKPRQLWFWIVGLALANAAAEYFALYTTDLLEYPHWSPLLSIPIYVLILRLMAAYTRWVWAPSGPWKPPGEI